MVKRVSEIAKETGVALQTVYRHLKKIHHAAKAHIFKEKGVVTLDEEGERLLKQSLHATTTALVPAVMPGNQAVDLTPVITRIEAMERAVLMLVEENKRLANENVALRIFLTPAPRNEKRGIAWQPEKAVDPMAGMTWYQRLWTEWFEPWKMRQHAA